MCIYIHIYITFCNDQRKQASYFADKETNLGNIKEDARGKMVQANQVKYF